MLINQVAEFMWGLLAGIMMSTPSIEPWHVVIGVVILAVDVVVAAMLCNDIGKISMGGVAKFLWCMIFFIFPIFSWIAYYFAIHRAS